MKIFFVMLCFIPAAGVVAAVDMVISAWKKVGKPDFFGVGFALLCLALIWALIGIMNHPEFCLTADGRIRRRIGR